MYIVPQRIPAPSAAHTPFSECADTGACAAEAVARNAAPTHITAAPPTTPIQRRRPACRSSLKNRQPHKIPSRLFEFHNGKAMLRPISRIAKIVSVLATAHKQPASSAQSTRCGARLTSARKENSNHHDERNHHRRNADGHKLCRRFRGAKPRPGRKSTQGAKNLQASRSRRLLRLPGGVARYAPLHDPPSERLVNEPQQQQPAHQHGHRDPKMNILKHTHKPGKSCLICRVVGHKSAAEKPGRRELYPRELFVTNGPKKSANHERPAAWL